MSNVAFNISDRNENVKKVRQNGEIPGVLYGDDLDNPISIKMVRSDVDKLLKCSKSSILDLNLNGQIEKCVVKDLQKDTYGKVIHIDFKNVRKDENIKLKIQINFIGVGILESKRLLLGTFLNEIELHGEVDKFPESIELDVSKLGFGDKVLASDLSIPEGIVLGIDKDTIIAKVEGNVTVEENKK
ncbi:MAG: 50S ribosomal protein L25 [Clostridium butyricum]|nr:50S ribosomal protein L25 [Clostridium butyricum]